MSDQPDLTTMNKCVRTHEKKNIYLACFLLRSSCLMSFSRESSWNKSLCAGNGEKEVELLAQTTRPVSERRDPRRSLTKTEVFILLSVSSSPSKARGSRDSSREQQVARNSRMTVDVFRLSVGECAV